MLRIRLRRVGKKRKPSYRIVVADARAPRDGAYLELIGNYDPMADPPITSLKGDRAVQWLSRGAQPSDAVRRILDKNGITRQSSGVGAAATAPVVEDAPAGGGPSVAVEEAAADVPNAGVDETATDDEAPADVSSDGGPSA